MILNPTATIRRDEELIPLFLTPDEAWEVLLRCMKSLDSDSPAARSAMQKLARATTNRPGHGGEC